MTMDDDSLCLYDTAAALFLHEPDAAELEVRQEYFDLFFVPVSGRYLAPFEAAQRERRLWGLCTYQTAELYQQVGFDPRALSISPLWGEQLPPDHAGVELAFVSALLKQADVSGREEQIGIARTLESFWKQHLSRWLPDYGRKLARTARTEHYRLLGSLVEYLGEKSPQEELEFSARIRE
jgi:putative dimethyl sulfoxide reductase chaperone